MNDWTVQCAVKIKVRLKTGDKTTGGMEGVHVRLEMSQLTSSDYDLPGESDSHQTELSKGYDGTNVCLR